ncbi:MAG: hypothetical protein JSS02_01245 [Planctomycetes bacterium]|nr:hypothetical protein [Planctomycetota bacterium]
MIRSRLHLCLLILLISQLFRYGRADETPLFQRPARNEVSRRLQTRAVFLVQQGQTAEALQLTEQAVRVAPFSARAHYNFACLQALSRQPDQALESLKLAVELGFRDVTTLKQDPDLATLRGRPEYAAVVEAAQKPLPAPEPRPGEFDGDIAWVGPENTAWNESTNLLRTAFRWQRPEKPAPVARENGDVAQKLSQWFASGTAAGHFGDLYDNWDRDHSALDCGPFPQLHRVEYRPSIARDTGYGLQNRILHGGVVFGNSSTANTDARFWRSNSRQAYGDAGSMLCLTVQYFQNHLYVYPEHRDHDPGHNGPDGYGDVFPANTPYLLTSQGSSGSDLPILKALACTLAAFQPEVKQRIVAAGLMAPTLQSLVRSTYGACRQPSDYFTGLAHPSVFEGTQIDPARMIEVAHQMTVDTIPPLARLRIESQDRGLVGRDYFDIGDRETLFDTPCAIARIGRSVQFERKMILSAQDSADIQKRPLKFRWEILRGDPTRISVKPLDEAGTRAELTIGWHPRRPTYPESAIESNRVDIGVFAHNGSTWSAPAFVSWLFLDNEEREYDKHQRIQSVTYHGGTDSGNYVDPLIQTPKTWKDTYHYSADGTLTGWTRTRPGAEAPPPEEFTRDGALVLTRDDRGRAVTAQAVRYAEELRSGGLPCLTQSPGDEIWRYAYAGDKDLIGKVVSKEKRTP